MSDLFDKLGKVWGDRGPTLGIAEFLLLLALSGAAAFVLALLYTRFFGSRSSGSDIHRAFPLLAIAITAIFVCIQFSLPLSLGLLGALSIVRFRTPIKEPEEIGFLMVVIATSLATATGLLGFLAAVLLAAVVALVVQRGTGGIFRRRSESGLVIATFLEDDYRSRGAAVLDELAHSGRSGGLESLATQDGRVTVTWRFHGLPGSKAAALEQSLKDRGAPQTLAIVYAADAALP